MNNSMLKQIHVLKAQLNELDQFCWQLKQRIYEIEEKMLDEQDKELNKFIYEVV